MKVNVSIVFEEDVRSIALMERYAALLSREERERESAFVFEVDQRRHRITRALVRTVLSEEIPAVAPQDWCFEVGAHGRPEIHPSHGISELQFNVSHTAGAVVLAVTRSGLIGIDVEDRTRRGATTEIADRFFSPSEVAELRALPASEQRERFFVLWTLKESYIKARGLGLSLPLDSFSFGVAGDRISFDCDTRCNDDPGRWRFATFALTSKLAMSIGGAGGDLEIALERTVPLEHKTRLRDLPILSTP